MIKETIELLQSLPFYNGSENIEFAKGLYRYPRNIKDTFRVGIRWIKRKTQ
jgi:hypothetical protein